MITSLNISYMHGLGNQFAIIDLTSLNQLSIADFNSSLIEKILSASKGYKIDQLLVLSNPTTSSADFDYFIFNQDGSRAEQCGNGSRCIAKFIYDFHKEKITDKKDSDNLSFILHLSNQTTMRVQYISDKKIIAVLEKENFDPKTIGLNIDKVVRHQVKKNNYYLANLKNIDFYAVSMGNPHMVIDIISLQSKDKFEKINIHPIAQAFQKQTDLFMNGVNVNFVQILNRNEIKLRTYERGVGETMACGSGACASFASLRADHRVDKNLTIHLSQGKLELSHTDSGKLKMIGPAEFQEQRTIFL